MSNFTTAVTGGPLVLDGGLGTLLDQRGHDVSSALWSAALLVDDPEAIRSAHAEFFAAGADLAITASYQVTYEALGNAGLSAPDVDALLTTSVELAQAARPESATRPLWVAASVGPYGAMLADGSEYRGDYGLSVAELRRWHHRRLATLAGTTADVLAIETIPALAEVDALARELEGTASTAWLSVTVENGRLRSGESLAEAFAIADDVAEIRALGVNCCDPDEVLIAREIAASVTDKPFLAYPNTGERWDAANRSWSGAPQFPAALVASWRDAGIRLIGGCCRVGPDEIGRMAEVIRGHAH